MPKYKSSKSLVSLGKVMVLLSKASKGGRQPCISPSEESMRKQKKQIQSHEVVGRIVRKPVFLNMYIMECYTYCCSYCCPQEP